MTSERIDVVKLIRIILYFAGVVMIVSGITSGLFRLDGRTPLNAYVGADSLAPRILGMLLFCPLAFGGVFLGLACIRYNGPLARRMEKYSRKRARIGKPCWKLSEIHALFSVFLGAYLLYAGILEVFNCMIYGIEAVSLLRDMPGGTFRWIWEVLIFVIPLILLYYLLPGGLLIRFAPKLTALIGNALGSR